MAALHQNPMETPLRFRSRPYGGRLSSQQDTCSFTTLPNMQHIAAVRSLSVFGLHKDDLLIGESLCNHAFV